MALSTHTTKATPRKPDNDEFPTMARLMSARATGFSAPFFKVDVKKPLYEVYLSGFTNAVEKQHHTCHACKRFFDKYANLVVINDDGTVESVFWSMDSRRVPYVYKRSVELLRKAVESAPVSGVFLDSERVWGSEPTFDAVRNYTWTHFQSGALDHFSHPTLSAGQKMAEREQEYGMLGRALDEFSFATVQRAVGLLMSEQLFRGEKTLGVAQWLLDVHDKVRNARGAKRRNLLWKVTASAPAGFCHVKASMIGTLLEDLQNGLGLDEVKRRFDEKMDPLKYQRAQVPPKAGTIDQANKVVDQLNAAGALKRRFASIYDVELLWKPKQPQQQPATPYRGDHVGTFDHLRRRTHAHVVRDAAHTQRFTWEKFARVVLPNAERIEYLVPANGNFIALVTQEHTYASPILQWDHAERRNPVSWYVYNGGSTARQWNLVQGWCDVVGITLLPPMWHEPEKFKHHGQGTILLLDKCHDTGYVKGGGLFSESLRSEFHQVRSVIEAHVASAVIAGKHDPNRACGIDLRAGQTWNAEVRVTTGGLRSTYILDRWD